MYLPHQFIEHQLQHRFDQTIRRNYFRGMEFAGPAGDPGWFGPGSAVWHVHSHTEALVFGLQCAAFIERLDPSILGGMILKIGSRLYDTSIKSRLQRLSYAMKGAA